VVRVFRGGKRFVLYGSESKAINHGTHGIHGKKHKIVMSRWLFVTGLLPCGPCIPWWKKVCVVWFRVKGN